MSKKQQKLDRRNSNINNSESSNNNNEITAEDDYYYLARGSGSEPPRFAYYRHVRAKHCLGGTRTYQDVWDTITQEELDYYLKAKLRVPPEQRYQNQKREPWWHETAYAMRGLDAYDGYGCNHFTGCIPECRFYPKEGRIEDEEVIDSHNRRVESERQKNAIIDPPDLNTEEARSYFRNW